MSAFNRNSILLLLQDSCELIGYMKQTTDMEKEIEEVGQRWKTTQEIDHREKIQLETQLSNEIRKIERQQRLSQQRLRSEHSQRQNSRREATRSHDTFVAQVVGVLLVWCGIAGFKALLFSAGIVAFGILEKMLSPLFSGILWTIFIALYLITDYKSKAYLEMEALLRFVTMKRKKMEMTADKAERVFILASKVKENQKNQSALKTLTGGKRLNFEEEFGKLQLEI